MLIGLATYLVGYPHLRAASARHAPEPAPEGGAAPGRDSYRGGAGGRPYEIMTPTAFWLLHAAIAATGAILAMTVGRPLKRILDAASGGT